jgi:hypothetical protein
LRFSFGFIQVVDLLTGVKDVDELCEKGNAGAGHGGDMEYRAST